MRNWGYSLFIYLFIFYNRLAHVIIVSGSHVYPVFPIVIRNFERELWYCYSDTSIYYCVVTANVHIKLHSERLINLSSELWSALQQIHTIRLNQVYFRLCQSCGFTCTNQVDL